MNSASTASRARAFVSSQYCRAMETARLHWAWPGPRNCRRSISLYLRVRRHAGARRESAAKFMKTVPAKQLTVLRLACHQYPSDRRRDFCRLEKWRLCTSTHPAPSRSMAASWFPDQGSALAGFAASGRQRRCSQSHCSGCSRIQPSTTPVMICMVPAMSILPSRVARRRDLVGYFAAKACAGQPDNAHAVDRAFEMPGELRQQRIGHGALAEEGHLDAAHVILVDQHADMGAALQRVGELHRRVQSRSRSIRP